MWSKTAILSILLNLPIIGASLADDRVYSGPFYKCPDAHGDKQKALFSIIDITRFPMRIEGLGQRRVDGFAANLAASISDVMMKEDPIGKAAQRMGEVAAPMAKGFDQQYVEVCFATEPPPTDPNIDGPFYYMPGFFVESAVTAVLQPMDSILIPEQTYLVVSYEGPSANIGNLRFTMTEDFWPKTAPFLGIERVDGPNLQIFAPGLKGTEEQTKLELWTPIKPYVISPR
jgi:hypothetical protein